MDEEGVSTWGGDCSVAPTFSGDGGRLNTAGTGGAVDVDEWRAAIDGWREADLRYESTAPSQSIDGDWGDPRDGTGGLR